MIQAAAMDVFETEPLPPGSLLHGLDGLTMTPHIAASSAETFNLSVRQMFDNILRVSRREALPEQDAVVP